MNELVPPKRLSEFGFQKLKYSPLLIAACTIEHVGNTKVEVSIEEDPYICNSVHTRKLIYDPHGPYAEMGLSPFSQTGGLPIYKVGANEIVPVVERDAGASNYQFHGDLGSNISRSINHIINLDEAQAFSTFLDLIALATIKDKKYLVMLMSDNPVEQKAYNEILEWHKYVLSLKNISYDGFCPAKVENMSVGNQQVLHVRSELQGVKQDLLFEGLISVDTGNRKFARSAIINFLGIKRVVLPTHCWLQFVDAETKGKARPPKFVNRLIMPVPRQYVGINSGRVAGLRKYLTKPPLPTPNLLTALQAVS